MDIVSFETAKKLKEAGFPQPEYIALGFGYTDNGTRFYIEECRFPMGGVNGMYFAPTATDIMREIYNHFEEMPGYSVEIILFPRDDGYQIRIFEDLPFDAMKPVVKFGKIAAGAAALAWLELNKTLKMSNKF